MTAEPRPQLLQIICSVCGETCAEWEGHMLVQEHDVMAICVDCFRSPGVELYVSAELIERRERNRAARSDLVDQWGAAPDG